MRGQDCARLLLTQWVRSLKQTNDMKASARRTICTPTLLTLFSQLIPIINHASPWNFFFFFVFARSRREKKWRRRRPRMTSPHVSAQCQSAGTLRTTKSRPRGTVDADQWPRKRRSKRSTHTQTACSICNCAMTCGGLVEVATHCG